MEIKLKDEDYGKEYLIELLKILDTRKERKLIYGDSFLDEKIENLMVIIDGKWGRAKVVKKINGILHPKYRDELSDVINYLIFILCKISEREKKDGSD